MQSSSNIVVAHQSNSHFYKSDSADFMAEDSFGLGDDVEFSGFCNQEMALNLSPSGSGTKSMDNSPLSNLKDSIYSPMSVCSPSPLALKKPLSLNGSNRLLFSSRSHVSEESPLRFEKITADPIETAPPPPRYPSKPCKLSHWNARSVTISCMDPSGSKPSSKESSNSESCTKSPPSSPCKTRYGRLPLARVNPSSINQNLAKIRRTQSQCYTEDCFVNNPLNSKIVESGEICSLPCLEGGKDAIKRIHPDTVVALMERKFSDKIDQFYIVDCRFPYEYEGGHIIGGININTMEELDRRFLDNPIANGEKVALIFHCEFSSHRAPRMALHLRREDRIRNMKNYPDLWYPEVYILDGGYRNFFSLYKNKCFPQRYIEMNDQGFRDECRKEMTFFKKSWKRSKSFSDANSTFIPK